MSPLEPVPIVPFGIFTLLIYQPRNCFFRSALNTSFWPGDVGGQTVCFATERLARGEAIVALCGPDFPEMGAGFSRWDQVFQSAWVLATPSMFFKMHRMNCSYFYKALVGATLPEHFWRLHGHEWDGSKCMDVKLMPWLHRLVVSALLHHSQLFSVLE